MNGTTCRLLIEASGTKTKEGVQALLDKVENSVDRVRIMFQTL